MQSADQSLSNHQEVKVYGARAAEFERYSALADRHMRLSLKVESTRSISSAMVQLMGSIGLAMLLFVAGREAMAGRLSAGGDGKGGVEGKRGVVRVEFGGGRVTKKKKHE